MCQDGRCEPFNEGLVEDIVHFLLYYEALADDRRLLDVIKGPINLTYYQRVRWYSIYGWINFLNGTPKTAKNQSLNFC